MDQDAGSSKNVVLEVGIATRWQQRTRSESMQASGSWEVCPQWGLGRGTACAALLRCLNLCSLNFWTENYVSAAVDMQVFGDKINSLKQPLSGKWISTGQSRVKSSSEFLAWTPFHFSLFWSEMLPNHDLCYPLLLCFPVIIIIPVCSSAPLCWFL